MFFTSKLKRYLSYALSATIITTSLPVMPAMAAERISLSCNNTSASDAGKDPFCITRKVGDTYVSAPKIQWKILTTTNLTQNTSPNNSSQGSNFSSPNKSAIALGLSPAEVAKAVSFAPANVPYVFARYNPVDGMLKIDIFKLEKSSDPATGQQKVNLMTAPFAPDNGDYWKLSRSYISPDQYKQGRTPGVNPFSAYKGSDPTIFYNISFTGAQVAIGHAMRYAGAVTSLVQVMTPRLSQEQYSSSSLFRKTTTTIIRGHEKPTWLIGQPMRLTANSTSLPMAGICASDPAQTSCPMYNLATSGVSFEQIQGGSLDETEDTWELDRQSQSGWSFFAVLIFAVIGSFAAAGLLGAAGLLPAGDIATGLFGSLLTNSGLIGGISSLSLAVGIEASYYIAAMTLIGGASPGSTLSLGPDVLMGNVRTASGIFTAQSLDTYNQRLNAYASPSTTTNIDNTTKLLSGFKNTVFGSCDPSIKAADCNQIKTGVAPRVDMYIENNDQLIRDNNGNGVIVRDIYQQK